MITPLSVPISAHHDMEYWGRCTETTDVNVITVEMLETSKFKTSYPTYMHQHGATCSKKKVTVWLLSLSKLELVCPWIL